MEYFKFMWKTKTILTPWAYKSLLFQDAVILYAKQAYKNRKNANKVCNSKNLRQVFITHKGLKYKDPVGKTLKEIAECNERYVEMHPGFFSKEYIQNLKFMKFRDLINS